MELMLKKIRIEKDKTIRELAELSGVSRASISRMERGEEVPTIEAICKLAKALEVDSSDIYKCK